MDAIFWKLCNIGISAGWVILAVVALRFCFRRSPKWCCCILWAIVAARLLCPFSIESPFSLVPGANLLDGICSLPGISSRTGTNPLPSINSLTGTDPFSNTSSSPGAGFLPGTQPRLSARHSAEPDAGAQQHLYNPVATDTESNPVSPPERTVDDLQTECTPPSWIPAARTVWLTVLAGMLLYALLHTIHIRSYIREAVLLSGNVYLCDTVHTPFILGIFAPRIYLPSGQEEGSLQYMLAHEQAHIKRKDHWWKPLGFLLLSIYWFQPLAWPAYALFCRDIEFACDEKVIRNLDLDGKKSYSHTMVSCATRHKLLLVYPLSFAETGIKERVKKIMHYQKPPYWIITLSVAACILTAVCFLTNPKSGASQTSAMQNSTTRSANSHGNSPTNGHSNPPADSTGKMADSHSNPPADSTCKMADNQNNPPADSTGKMADNQNNPAKDRTDSLPLDGKRRLTLDDVIRLSKKGKDLSWTDFSPYSYRQIGSGLYIFLYEIDDTFSLWIGGTHYPQEPFYFYLNYLKAKEPSKCRIDIRDGGVRSFIRKYKSKKATVLDGLYAFFRDFYQTRVIDSSKNYTKDDFESICGYITAKNLVNQRQQDAISSNEVTRIQVDKIDIYEMSRKKDRLEIDASVHYLYGQNFSQKSDKCAGSNYYHITMRYENGDYKVVDIDDTDNVEIRMIKAAVTAAPDSAKAYEQADAYFAKLLQNAVDTAQLPTLGN